jgi:hypothetical protein
MILHQATLKPAASSRLSVWLVLLVMLSACGTIDSGAPSDPVAATAWREWRRAGGEVLVYGGTGSHNGGVHETQEPMASRIAEYWALVGRPEWDGRSDKPWSGIFVSWVVDRAGVPRSDFTPSGRHAGFLAPLLDDQLNGGARRFVVHDWRGRAPRAGDLVCSGTRHAPPRDAAELRSSVDREAAHCDVVVDVRGGFVRAIGGNVRDTVTMSLYPLERGGTLAEIRGRPWFAVVEKRR